MSKREIKPSNITISTGTTIKILSILVGLAFIWFIKDVLAIFFVALLLAALIDPFASWFEKKKIPRGFGVLLVYVVLLAILVTAFVIIVPPLVSQLVGLGKSLEGTFVELRGVFEHIIALSEEYGLAESLASSVDSLQQGATSAIFTTITTVAGTIGGFATSILILVITYYMVSEEGLAKKTFRHFAPKKYQPYIAGLVGRIQVKLGAWLRGQILLMLIIGVMTYLGLLIIGIDYALVLGIFAGLAEIVPYAGPIISAVPAIIIAFTISPLKAVIVALLYFGIQQLENGVLTPKIMEKSVGLNPLVSLFALLVGFKLGGLIFSDLKLIGNIVGALLAIPVATIVAVIMHDILGNFDHKKQDSTK